MIVICTKCQAKFRVADDKIGPRGAKVRCSKCQTVFLVHPDLGSISVTNGELRPTVTPVPPTAAASAPAAGPPQSPGSPRPAPDPFAAASPPGPDPFATAP